MKSMSIVLIQISVSSPTMEDVPTADGASRQNLMSTVEAVCRVFSLTQMTLMAPDHVIVRCIISCLQESNSMVHLYLTVEIGFEFSFYFGSEDAQQTGEICVVFLADTSQLVNDIRGIYDDPTFNIQPVGAVITTQMTGDASGIYRGPKTDCIHQRVGIETLYTCTGMQTILLLLLYKCKNH